MKARQLHSDAGLEPQIGSKRVKGDFATAHFKRGPSLGERELECCYGIGYEKPGELEQLAANLRQQILLHPEHSRLDSVELEDVEEWIALRQQEKKTA